MSLLAPADQEKLRAVFSEMTHAVRLLFVTQTIGCETWRLDGHILSVWGVHHVEDLGEFPYREIWRRVP